MNQFHPQFLGKEHKRLIGKVIYNYKSYYIDQYKKNHLLMTVTDYV